MVLTDRAAAVIRLVKVAGVATVVLRLVQGTVAVAVGSVAQRVLGLCRDLLASRSWFAM